MSIGSAITLELPEALVRQLDAQQISEQELRIVLIAALEVWLAQRAGAPEPAEGSGRFTESAVPFIKRLVAQNRALFEELARR